MADESSSDQEKTEDPSAHRIEEFRKRGEVASSKELSSVLVLAATFMTMTITVTYIFEEIHTFIEWLYTLDVATAFTEKSLDTITRRSMAAAIKSAGPIVGVSLIIGVFVNVAQVGLLFSPEVLNFKPERINPIEGVKKLFTMRSIVEALKAIFKFAIIAGIVFYFLKDKLLSFNGFLHTDALTSFIYGKDIIAKLLFLILIGLFVLAGLDFAYQKYTYMQKLKMTKDEAKRETKEQDGNPEIKQRIKALQREMSQKRMAENVAKADVIVTNPTHISIAISYNENMVAPEIVAKGADFMALSIRKIAKKHNVPIVENIPLARTLYKTVKVGDGVPRNLYKAVADVLAFVYRLKRKKKF